MIQIKKTILTLVALLAVTTGAWAQTERLLTTITPTGNTTYSETNPGAVTVTQDCEYYNSGYGWVFDQKTGSVTVEANGGYTISKCVFTLSNGSTTTLTISTPPYKINFVWDDEIGGCYCEGTEKYDIYFGVKSIQVYTTTVDVTGINLDKTEASMTVGGDALTLTATVAPANATNKTVTWTTSDPTVATVTNGVVTAVAAGTATITATATNGTADTSDDFSATCEVTVAAPAASGPEVAWNKAEKTGTFTMPGGNVTLEPEYYPQAALTAQPTAINDVPATTDGAIVKAGTVANIGTTETAQGTVMYYVSQTALDDAALLALAADQWTADVPTAEKLTKGEAYVYYYVRGNDSDTDEENFSDGDILAANALQVTLGAAPLWNAEFDLTDAPEADKTGKWSTNIPEGGVTKGQTVTVTYTGSKKVIGVKAEKKAAAPASNPLDNTTTAWSAGTFVVPAGGLTYSDAITVSGDVTLVLTDGETLTLNKGISLASGATLTVEGNGTMNVNGTNGNTSSTVAGTGTLVLTSGTLNAKGGNGQSITANDMPTVDNNTGASGGVAINGNVTVSGGTVTATGGNGGNLNTSGLPDGGTENNHAGNGGAAISGTVTVNAGGWTATNGSNGTYTSSGDDSNCSAGAGGKAVAGTVTDNR